MAFDLSSLDASVRALERALKVTSDASQWAALSALDALRKRND